MSRSGGGKRGSMTDGKKSGLRLRSEVFGQGEPIPARYTADGEDVSPPLSWSAVPPESKSLVLTCEDPDAPRGTWIHWVVYDIPPSVSELPEGVPPRETLPTGGTHGKNDFGRLGYGGPAPPSGTHRYFFRLEALDRTVSLPPGASLAQVRRASEGHVLARGELMGTYSRR
ncbi:MAG TPA: YbhB/YbcL family Raf kinase inhibitor-like protein [Thermoanaerobaculia bacterium]|nr:YbhB/YbcL family Raf kinase inhibitor-like protein [Thermoanaerobaculia bacterium]